MSCSLALTRAGQRMVHCDRKCLWCSSSTRRSVHAWCSAANTPGKGRRGGRGRRHRGSRCPVGIASANVAAWSGAQQCLAALALARSAMVVSAQEAKAATDQEVAAVHAWCKMSGWRAIVAPAVVVPCGRRSAGVAMFVRAGIAMAAPKPAPWGGVLEASCCVAAHVDVGIRGGLFVVSTYFFTGEGLSERNMALAARVAGWLHTQARTFVWAADWQNTPEAIGSCGFVQQLRASIMAPAVDGRGTRSNGSRVIDFFVVHPAVRPLLSKGCRVAFETLTRPHWPVIASLDMSRKALGHWRICKPAPMPVWPPAGCALDPGSAESVARAREWANLTAAVNDATDNSQVDQCVLHWYALAQEELLVTFYGVDGSRPIIGNVASVCWSSTTAQPVGERAAGDRWTTHVLGHFRSEAQGAGQSPGCSGAREDPWAAGGA